MFHEDRTKIVDFILIVLFWPVRNSLEHPLLRYCSSESKYVQYSCLDYFVVPSCCLALLVQFLPRTHLRACIVNPYDGLRGLLHARRRQSAAHTAKEIQSSKTNMARNIKKGLQSLPAFLIHMCSVWGRLASYMCYSEIIFRWLMLLWL